MTDTELELGRLRAKLWRLEQERAMWTRYAGRLERQIKELRNPEPAGEWYPNPATSGRCCWWLRGAD